MKINIPSHLSDVQLVAEVTRFASCARAATAQLVAHLAELDARRLYLGAGFSSLFAYCNEMLGISEHEIYNRIEAARAARRFPVILDLLSEGLLNLTTVRLLAPHLANNNCEELLAAASRRSKRQVEELLARRFPRPDEPSLIRRLPTATPETDPSVPSVAPAGPPSSRDPRDARDPRLLEPSTSASVPRSTEGVSSARTPRPVVAPLAEDRYVIKFTASAATCEKLRRAQDLLRHAIPNGDPAEIVDRALTVLLEDLARKKFEHPAALSGPQRLRGRALLRPRQNDGR